MCRKLARCRPNIVIVFGLTDLKQTVGAGKIKGVSFVFFWNENLPVRFSDEKFPTARSRI